MNATRPRWFSPRPAPFRRVTPLWLEALETRTLMSASSVGQIPLSFEPNLGQADSQVQFLARGPGYGLFLTNQEAILALTQPTTPTTDSTQLLDAAAKPAAPSVSVESLVHVQFVGAQSNAQLVGLDQLDSKSNYIIGADPAGW